MKQLRQAWTPRLVVAAALTIAGAAYAQQTPQQNNDPYQGVSQPPPDDTITASADAAQPPAAKPSPATPAATPPPPPPAAAYTAPAPTPAPVSSSHVYNPDDDIVSSVPSQGPSQYDGSDAGTATLQTRYNPDSSIVNVVHSPANELPEGTNVRVRLTERLSTNDTTEGSPFRGEVTTAVFKDGSIIIPPGSILKGRVIGVRQGHHFTGAATLRLRPDMIILPDGTAYHLYAQVIQSKAPGTRTDSEGGIQPSSHWKKETAEYGVGVGAGAITGAHFGGPQGALIGAGIGATLITAHLLMQHPAAAVLPSGSIVTFSLSEPMELTPTRN